VTVMPRRPGVVGPYFLIAIVLFSFVYLMNYYRGHIPIEEPSAGSV